MGVCNDGPLKTLLKSLDVPYMDFEIEPKDQSIGSMGVFSSGQEWPLCREHYYGNNDVGFVDCARVKACQMEWWVRKQICYEPSLERVNRQRVIWQTRCDRLMDMLLCNLASTKRTRPMRRERVCNGASTATGPAYEWLTF